MDQLKEKLREIMIYILYVTCNFRKYIFALLIVYLDARDVNRNQKIIEKLENIVKDWEIKQTPVIIVGDFNAHIGIVGNQSVNANGRLILDLLNKFNLVLLNEDEICEGEIAWSRENYKSAIDFFCVTSESMKFLIG